MTETEKRLVSITKISAKIDKYLQFMQRPWVREILEKRRQDQIAGIQPTTYQVTIEQYTAAEELQEQPPRIFGYDLVI